MVEEGRGRERDLVLSPGEFAHILDETKGHVGVWVGPVKTSLAGTDAPVVYNEGTGRFPKVQLPEAIQACPLAREGEYVVLQNPATAREGKSSHPGAGSSSLPELNYGRKINIPGPSTFPLWPGQVARVIPGHDLRSNQYLVVTVYDEPAAQANWGKAVMKPQRPNEPGEKLPDRPGGESQAAGPNESEDRSANPSTAKPDAETPDLTMGKLMVIKGTDISFYIPPTGIEVVPDEDGRYIRNAVTLERLEYCILLDENGNKRYLQGPDVVFPKPTETFIADEKGNKKFKAVELNELMGIYIKVIADYEDGSKKYKAGEELFITGADQKIYFPRPEHAIIKYGDQNIHYAVAVPAGEGRYVLNRESGEVKLKKGPVMFLPDPRKEVIVRRVLGTKLVRLYYPGNDEAVGYNQRLLDDLEKEKWADEEKFPPKREMRQPASKCGDIFSTQAVRGERLAAEDFSRNPTFTAPRTITLDTKYEGAVTVDVWTNYAVQVVSKSGKRRVVVGPETVLLEYDEALEVLELSTGRPKSDDKPIKTVYLRVRNNIVSDLVGAETKDMVEVKVGVSYRVNFEDDSTKWFGVENYVKILTDHLRSMIRNKIKQCGIEEFNANAINIIRDTVLGAQEQEGKRPGREFEENGMRVYDVEVLEVAIGDKHIADMLSEAQHDSVSQALEIAAKERTLDAVKRSEEIEQEMVSAKAKTAETKHGLLMTDLKRRLEGALAELANSLKIAEDQFAGKLKEQEYLNGIAKAELQRDKAKREQEIALSGEQLGQDLRRLEAEVKAIKEKAEAISPDFISALQAFGDKDLVGKMAESMGPLAILGGKSVADVLKALLAGTPLEDVVSKLAMGAKDTSKKN